MRAKRVVWFDYDLGALVALIGISAVSLLVFSGL
jgi:hypothetical protein